MGSTPILVDKGQKGRGTASKAICQRFRGNLAEFETAVCQSFDFTQLPDFGETLHRNIHQWFRSEENWTIWTELRRLVCIKTYGNTAQKRCGIKVSVVKYGHG